MWVEKKYTYWKCRRFIIVSSDIISLAETFENLLDVSVLFIAQEEVKRYHRYCNHSGGQAAPKVDR